MKLKENDKKILKELLINGRADFSTIAKKNNLTEKMVWNRYNSLKKAGVIVGTTTHVDYRKCYGIYTVFMIKMPPNRRDTAIDSIRKMSKVYVISKGLQNNALIVGITIKDMNEIDKVKNKLSTFTLADEITSEIWLDVINRPENLQILSSNNENDLDFEEKADIKKISKSINIKIDKTDFEIIDLLSINGRMPFSHIAKRIGKSHDTVTKRYNKLVKSGIIKVVTQINPIELGYKGWMVIMLSFSARIQLSEKIKEIMKIPDVVHLVKTKGIFDIVVYTFIKDIDQLFEMQKRIAKINGLIKLEISNNEILNIWPTPKQYKSTI